MGFRSKFVVEPGDKVRLGRINPSYTGKHTSHRSALPEIQKHVARMDGLQYLLYAEGNQSLLIVLQALDAGGKDGVIRHLFTGMNPQGTTVVGFKQPSKVEAAHDFLWRAHRHTPGKGEIVIFNRSHYEDVLVVRVHELVPQVGVGETLRADQRLREDAGRERHPHAQVLSPHQPAGAAGALQAAPRRPGAAVEDQPVRLQRAQALVGLRRGLRGRHRARPARGMHRGTSCPSNHKWFRDLAISEIVADTLEDMDLKLPPTQVDIAAIRRQYHAAARAQAHGGTKNTE